MSGDFKYNPIAARPSVPDRDTPVGHCASQQPIGLRAAQRADRPGRPALQADTAGLEFEPPASEVVHPPIKRRSADLQCFRSQAAVAVRFLEGATEFAELRVLQP